MDKSCTPASAVYLKLPKCPSGAVEIQKDLIFVLFFNIIFLEFTNSLQTGSQQQIQFEILQVTSSGLGENSLISSRHRLSSPTAMDFFTLVGLSACFYFLIYVIFLCFSDCDLQLAFFEKFGQKSVELRGKVAWVTGASTALGQSMALEMASQGGKLALSSNSLEGLKKVKALCLNINPLLRSKDILVFQLDVGEISGHRAAVRKVLQHFGTIDVLILNEDKWETNVWEDTFQSDRLLFRSNLFGVLSLSRLVVRYFNLKGSGKLAVASSIAGLIGIPYSGCYSASKHAIHGYFDCLRYEKMGENIQTTLLCLGSRKLLREEKLLGNDEVSPRKKMSPERCAHLCLAAIVNDLDEAWVAVFPGLPLIYGIKYFPNVTKSLLKYLTPKRKT